MAGIKDLAKLDEILPQTNLDDLSYLPMEEQHDEAEELLGVTTGPANDANLLSTSETALCDGACGDTRLGLDSRQGSFPYSSEILALS